MTAILIALGLILLPFGLVVAFGAPYLPAHRKAIETAVDELRLSKNGRVLDLGCGDGKFLLAAAKKGYRCTGYELNPALYLFCKLRFLRSKNVNIRFGSFWKADFPKDTEVVYVFLLDKFMTKLDGKMRSEANRLGKSLKLTSYVFKIPVKKAVKEAGGIRIYEYSPN